MHFSKVNLQRDGWLGGTWWQSSVVNERDPLVSRAALYIRWEPGRSYNTFSEGSLEGGSSETGVKCDCILHVNIFPLKE